MAKEVVEPGSAELGPDAYKKLYPAEFYKRFIDNNLRPDGRPFGGGRPVTIGVGAIESADASALVKIGSTSVLAGLTFAVVPTSADVVTEGELSLTVQMTPLCLGTADRRSGLETSQVLAYRVEQVIRRSQCLQLTKLVSKTGKANLKANLEIHVLDADGAELDACLLAAIATFASIKELPHAKALNNQDQEDTMKMDADSQKVDNFCNDQDIPLYHTIGLYGDNLMVDPTSEEEDLMDGLAIIALDSNDHVLGFEANKPARTTGLNTIAMTDCIEAAKLRHRDVKQLLHQALQASVD